MGWQQNRPELALGWQIPLSGLKHGLGSWPSNPVSPQHCHHAQEREVTQVLGPRCLLRQSDCGKLCQLGSGRCEIWKGQENCCQCCSAGSLPGSWSGISFWSWWALWHHKLQWWDWCPGGKHPWENYLQKKEEEEAQEKTWMGLEEKSIPWIFGYCWPPVSVLRTLWIFPWFVRMPGLSLALLPFGRGCTEDTTHWRPLCLCTCDLSQQRSCTVFRHVWSDLCTIYMSHLLRESPRIQPFQKALLAH